MSCLSALQDSTAFARRSRADHEFEIGMLGTKGFEINDSEQKYEIRSLPGKFSGLNMVCMMYVGFKIIAPDHCPAFDHLGGI